MELPMFSWVGLLIVVCVGILSLIYTFRSKSSHQLPPGPYGLPFIGHLHMLGDNPHHNLHKLSQKHGPIMQLRLGNVPTVVVSSPESAELFLKTHDTNFASRPKALGGDGKGMGAAQYGPYWRNLRRLCSIHLLSMSKVDSFKLVRKDKVSDLVRDIYKAAAESPVVNMSNQVGLVIEKITYGMIFGIEYNKGGYNIKDYIRDAEVIVGAFNIADYIPFLRPFDLQGLTKRANDVIKNLDETIEKIIDEHEHDTIGKQKNHKDFIDVMLSLMKTENDNEEKLDRSTVKALTLDMLAGAMDTSIGAIEWVLSELVRHPQVMQKVQEELSFAQEYTVVFCHGHTTFYCRMGLVRVASNGNVSSRVGKWDWTPSSSRRGRLSKVGLLLDMVVMETIRLHPVVGIYMRESMDDISIDNFYIPKKKAWIAINHWAISRDPVAWADKTEIFYPEHQYRCWQT
ncbi:Cytochrome p450 [Thalictrum thalictroides]|uniref:Cytochrome p450 n=1 Tax=Thalictrum thalictroides TaxID=46969 RepID=A0A7J6VJE1_THATH|nr:Cytochrome p450 [Thalictrum thalictroides]